MFDEGSLLKFTPFIFKNGAKPKPKYLIVLKNTDSKLLLATLPTSKDHVPADIPVEWGCVELPSRCVNVFVFTAGRQVAIDRSNTKSFAFPLNTFVYGADLDTYPVEEFNLQASEGRTNIENIGILRKEVFAELKQCLKNSSMVKNKFRRIL